MCTLARSPLAFGRYLQISSEVKTRTGAIKRTNALVIFQIAVCAERRDLFPAAFCVEAVFQHVVVEGALRSTTQKS